MGVLTKQELSHENTTLVDNYLFEVWCVMIVMTHLDFCRVLSHHRRAEWDTPTFVGCLAQYNTRRLAIGASRGSLMGNRRGSRCILFSNAQHMDVCGGRFLENKTGATP